MSEYRQYIAILSSLLLMLPVIAQGDRLIALSEGQMHLYIVTDKRLYYPGEIAVYTVTFKDSQGRPIDPDLIRATYDSNFIQLERVGDGVYRHITGKLTQRDHQLGVYAEKDGYNYVQESLTVRPITTQMASDNVKVTVVQQGDLLKIRLSNDILSRKEINSVRLVVIGASIESIATNSWIKVPNHVGIDLKSVYGSIGPGEKQTIKLHVNGKVSRVAWNVFDIHGSSIFAGAKNLAG